MTCVGHARHRARGTARGARRAPLTRRAPLDDRASTGRFGFGSVFANDETALRQIGLYSSIALGVSAACLVPLVVNILVPWRQVRAPDSARSAPRGGLTMRARAPRCRAMPPAPSWQVRANLIFIELSVLCASGTNLAVATFSYDFPTLLGGVVGMVGTALLVHFRVGLAKADGAGHEHASTVRPTSTRDAAAHAGGDDHIEHHSATPLPLGHQDSASHVHVVDVERLAPRTSSARQPATSRRMSGGSTAASSSQRSRADASSAKATDGNVSGADAASARPTRRDASQRGVVDMGALHEAADEDGERDGPHSPRAASGIAGSGRHPSAGTKHGAGVSSMSEIELASALRAEAARGAHDADDAHDAHDAHEVAERARLLDARLLRETSTSAFLMRTAPIWLTVLLLVLTRIEAIRIKGALRGTTPLFTLQLGTLGGLWLSASLVVGVSSILDVPSSSWSYELLYVPALLPFAVSGSAALLLFRRELVRPPRAIIAGVLGRMRGPSLSLVGAIALVNMMRGTPSDLSAPAYVVGVRVSSVLSHGWVVLCAVLGALGSFFSGSTTVSNLTFGSVQKRAAMLIGVSPTAMCALQACGASFGNAICLNNIIATSTVVGLKVSEGEIMKRTAPIVFGAYVIGTVMMIPFLYGTA